jgi:Gpi18-like mannosyltransferase
MTGPEKNFLVFPPLYPTLIRILSYIGIDSTFAAAIISNIFFILGMLILYKLVKSEWNEKIASLTVILISIFPTTYFLSIAYPESLFIFLFALSFYLAKNKSYFWAALVGGFAACTRPFGLVIFSSLILFMLSDKKLNIKNVVLSGIIYTIPLLPYIWINYNLFGNPLAFSTFLEQNWQKSFDFPWNGIISSWKRGIYTNDSFSYKYFVGYAEAIASTIAWVFVVFGIKKWKDKLPYLSYLFLGTLFFTSTGFILSAPRYLLSIPPFFILFAYILSKNKIIKFVWFGISLFLLVWFSFEFAQGRWAF